jgi:pilus assembly protein Flp/PilA
MLKPITFVMAFFNSLRESEEGNAAEYGLIIALVSVVIIAGLTALGLALLGVFNGVSAKLVVP